MPLWSYLRWPIMAGRPLVCVCTKKSIWNADMRVYGEMLLYLSVVNSVPVVRLGFVNSNTSSNTKSVQTDKKI